MRFEDERLLIRGAGGFLGGHLARRLLPLVRSMRLFVRHAERLPASFRADPKVEIVEADVRDADAVEASVEGIDTVLDFVGSTVPATPSLSLRLELELNLMPLALLLEVMVRRGTARLVLPSSGGTVYGRIAPRPVAEDAPLQPESPYGFGKVAAEEMVAFHARRHGLRYLVLRLANPYGRIEASTASQGVVDVFLQRVLEGLPIEVWGRGEQVRDFLLVDDTVAAVEALLRCGLENDVINVGSGRGTTLLEVMDIVEEVTGERLDRRYRDDVYSGIPFNVLDIDKLQRATGWQPRYDLRQGVAAAWARLQEAAAGDDGRLSSRQPPV